MVRLDIGLLPARYKWGYAYDENTMNRTALSMTVVVLALAIALPVAGLAAVDAGQPANADENASDSNASDAANVTAPGERMAGVVGVQQAELDSDIDQRSFGHQVAQAASNESRAAVVADRLAQIEAEYDNLSERRNALEAAYENGSINHGQYRSEVAQMAAQSGAIEEHANDSAAAAEDVPPGHLADRGINVSAIQMLQNNASNMTGQEVSEIARSIAGPGVGHGAGPPSDVPGRGDGPGVGDDHPGMGDGNPGMGDDHPGMGDDNETDDDVEDNETEDDGEDNETESPDDDSDSDEEDEESDGNETEDGIDVPVDEDDEDSADDGNETDDGGPPVETP